MGMLHRSAAGLALLAVVASCCCWLANVAFVPTYAVVDSVAPPSLRGASRASSAEASAGLSPDAAPRASCVPWLGMVGAAGALAMAGRLARSSSSPAPRTVLRARGGSSFDPAQQVGVTAPFGFFDPLKFSEAGNEASFRYLRASEIKHGRVAMMAALGAVVQHFIKLPGFEGVPAGINALFTSPGTEGFALLSLISGALEGGLWTENASKEPGNFGDPAGLNQYTTDMRNRELNNGRFAMFAAIGVISAELVSGKDAAEQWGL